MKKTLISLALVAMSLAFTAQATERCVSLVSATPPAPQTGAGNYEAGGGQTGPTARLDGSIANAANIAIGLRSQANGSGAIAIGDQAISEGIDTIAVGRRSEANGDSGVAIGNEAKATACHTSAIGASAEASGKGSTATGSRAKATGLLSTATGSASEATADGSTATGSYAKASGRLSTANGANSVASGGYSTALGSNSRASSTQSTAVGSDASATATQATAVGANARATHRNSVALGANSSTTRTDEVNVGSRVIGGVSDGYWDNDAVNLRQMRDNDEWTLKQANDYTDWRLSQLRLNINQLEDRLNTMGAQSAALTMMMGAGTNMPVGKVTFNTGVGFYGNKAAFAVGAKVRSSERTSWSLGLSYADGKALGGVGFAFTLD